jgi:sterol desaturase/sphingolipid hydroxylase (fatty acid hydroxylase superfamily)
MTRQAIAPSTSAAHEDNPDTLAGCVTTFFSYGSPRILTTLALGALAFRLSLGRWTIWDLAVAAGILAFWPVLEWLIHVFILHSKPFRIFGYTVDPEVPRKHREHHRDPWRTDLVFIPLQTYLYTPLLLVCLWFMAMPTTTLAATGIAVYLAMALHYEWVHFLVHTRYLPANAYYRRLRKNHRLHHCKNERYWYGVTMLGGDTLFDTAPDQKTVALSPTCRDLLSDGAIDESVGAT